MAGISSTYGILAEVWLMIFAQDSEETAGVPAVDAHHKWTAGGAGVEGIAE